MKEQTLKRWTLYGVCASLAAVAAWIGIKYALPLLLPFGAAYLISCAVRPVSLWLSKKTRLPKGLIAAATVALLAFLVTYLAYFSLSVLIREAVSAMGSLMELLKTEGNPVSSVIDRITTAMSGLEIIQGEDIGKAVTDMVGSAASAVSAWAAQAAGSLISKAPACFFSIFVGLISLFYFSMDPEGIKKEAKRFLPGQAMRSISEGLSVAKRAMVRFAKAYLVIMGITFAELLIGFTVIGVDYAFLAALIVAVIDILPVLGVGTVLVPWAAVLFFSGDTGAALSMLLLLCAMYVVRQIIEPRIVGSSAGVHPVTALVSVYAGYRLAGLTGMIAAPILLNAVAVLWEEKTAAGEKSISRS